MNSNLSQLLFTPFPRPQRSKKKLWYIILVGLGCSFFILLYQPFGIQNQTGEWLVDLVIFSLGVVFILAILFMEWVIPQLFPRLFNHWTLGKAVLWYTCVILFVGLTMFIYKNIWGGFREFTSLEFFLVVGRILIIGSTVSFIILGVWQYFNQKNIAAILANETYTVTAQNGKTIKLILKEILYISSDDNYVDIHYLADGIRQKAVFRSSLKNMEAQIVTPLSPIFRCHRQHLINIEYFTIEKMNSRSMLVTLDNYGDEIPVSKKYIDHIKQHLSTHP